MVYPALLKLKPHTSAASSRLNWRPSGRFKWIRPFRTKDEIWFLRVGHHISTSLYRWQLETLVLWLHAHFGKRNTEHHASVRPLLLLSLSVGFGWWFLPKVSDSSELQFFKHREIFLNLSLGHTFSETSTLSLRVSSACFFEDIAVS